ncbi:hypothetical protein [Clostridium botulinum]|nr:hypothetical protein [Clostridium botulinum]EKN40846.1 putative lipoprotein [Clostridium botulinum CFSAN001627]APC79032.1 putative lipoprotein [Clostridium botulinum]APC84012.1 putative lipoprotein [Clostridium botulinum]APQ77323.1 putative lipoprotein [Clostridium botulinum]AUM98784.1 hypothetical protein RSJ13_07120 [Clostridium botulinum]
MEKILCILMIGILSIGVVACGSKETSTEESKEQTKQEEVNKNTKKETKVEEKKEVKVEDNKKDLGIKVQNIKTLFEKEEIGFKFSNSPLEDGTPRQLGQSAEGKGAAILELYGKENLSKVYLGVFSASDSNEHNMFNVTYMLGIIKNVCPEFKDPDKWINSSIKELAENPEKTVTKDLGSKKITMDLKKDMGLFSINIEPK